MPQFKFISNAINVPMASATFSVPLKETGLKTPANSTKRTNSMNPLFPVA